MIRRPPRSTLFPYNDALPIFRIVRIVESRTLGVADRVSPAGGGDLHGNGNAIHLHRGMHLPGARDRKSTRLNSSHSQISYAVFCLKKKTSTRREVRRLTICTR